jgi:hypothetical protein
MKYRTTSIIAGTLLLCLQHGVKAQSPPEYVLSRSAETARLISSQARQIESALDERMRALANVICHEEIARYIKRGNTTNQVDTLDVNVEVQEGIEKYSGIRRREKTYADMQKVPGTWSVGEMATLLSATRDAIDLGQVQLGQDEASDLGRSYVMSFRYPAESRRWYLKAHSQVHWLSFEGRVWTAPETGEIRRISWEADNVPGDCGVSQVLWTVDFSRVDLSAMVVTLPQKALFRITYNNGGDRIDWNVTRFSEYKRYGSETAIHFDE